MSAITAALSQIDRVAAEGDLIPDPATRLELTTPGEPIVLPDGKRIYPPCLHGQPIDEQRSRCSTCKTRRSRRSCG
jgi:hypothetical protein